MRNGLEHDYRTIEPALTILASKLQQHVEDALRNTNHIDRISFRRKSIDSFLKKASKVDAEGKRKYSRPFEEVEDLVAGRVIVFFLRDVKAVLDVLDVTFNPVEQAHKAPGRDAEFGYESYHRIYHIPSALRSEKDLNLLPRTFELQVRTIFMHAYAEPQHDIHYKAAEELPADIRRELAWIAASAWGADHAYERVMKWMEGRSASALIEG